MTAMWEKRSEKFAPGENLEKAIKISFQENNESIYVPGCRGTCLMRRTCTIDILVIPNMGKWSEKFASGKHLEKAKKISFQENNKSIQVPGHRGTYLIRRTCNTNEEKDPWIKLLGER